MCMYSRLLVVSRGNTHELLDLKKNANLGMFDLYTTLNFQNYPAINEKSDGTDAEGKQGKLEYLQKMLHNNFYKHIHVLLFILPLVNFITFPYALHELIQNLEKYNLNGILHAVCHCHHASLPIVVLYDMVCFDVLKLLIEYWY